MVCHLRVPYLSISLKKLFQVALGDHCNSSGKLFLLWKHVFVNVNIGKLICCKTKTRPIYCGVLFALKASFHSVDDVHWIQCTCQTCFQVIMERTQHAVWFDLIEVVEFIKPNSMEMVQTRNFLSRVHYLDTEMIDWVRERVWITLFHPFWLSYKILPASYKRLWFNLRHAVLTVNC